VGNLNELTWS